MAELDAKLSIGELSLEALLALRSEMADMAGIMKKLLEMQELYEYVGPNQVNIGQGATAPTSGDLFLDLGGPNYGRVWEVRALVIGGLTFSTAAAGTAEVYQSSGQPTSRTLALLDDQANALPSVAFYSAGQLRVRHPNHLWVVIHTPTASQAYQAGGSALDSPDIPLRGAYAQ